MHEHVKLFLTVDKDHPEAGPLQKEIVALHVEANDDKPDDPARGSLQDQVGEVLHSLDNRLARQLGVQPTDLVHALPDAQHEQNFDRDETKVVSLYPMPRQAVDDLHQELSARPIPGIRLSVDLAVAPADSWCPGTATSPLFGSLDRALALIGAEVLGDRPQLGQNVTIVIIDQGVSSAHVPEMLHWQTRKPLGLTVLPTREEEGAPARVPGAAAFGHGTKMARLALQLAPRAQIFDVPLLPQRIHNAQGFLSEAYAVMDELRGVIEGDATDMRWVLCNAWSVYDLGGDHSDLEHSYAQDVRHAVNDVVTRLARMPQVDVVFAAGNCGQFCPDGRCGQDQVGPGNSIYGVAALPDVLTVGAVRSDTTWLGYSSQGPAPEGFGGTKPDLCAPSQFADPQDARIGYTGTSSACALTVGAIAALRGSSQSWPDESAALFRRLRETATRLPGQAGATDPCLGAGILNLRGLFGRAGRA